MSMPSTRYQGSKRKLLPQLEEIFNGLSFDTCLDAFGGTGSVTHLLRSLGKRVDYNDILPANAVIAMALFANTNVRSTVDDVESIFVKKHDVNYRDYIAKYYNGIYYVDNENEELDIVLQNIMNINDSFVKNEMYYCLFQSAISKRPYNLFHRANVDMRLREVKRSFGNKATWDRPFVEHMKKFHRELSIYRERTYDNDTTIMCGSAFNIKKKYDLIYIDTPYAKSKKTQETNYYNFYHFLDAMLDYANIPDNILSDYAHRPIYEPNKLWYDHKDINHAFSDLFNKYKTSKLVISYRSDGHPSPEELLSMLQDSYKSVDIIHLSDYKYVLSSQKTDTKEIVIVAK
jgi:adenine-specific DNA methylase